MVTNMGRGVFLLGQPRYCICTNASRDLSAIAAFLVKITAKTFRLLFFGHIRSYRLTFSSDIWHGGEDLKVFMVTRILKPQRGNRGACVFSA